MRQAHRTWYKQLRAMESQVYGTLITARVLMRMNGFSVYQKELNTGHVFARC